MSFQFFLLCFSAGSKAVCDDYRLSRTRAEQEKKRLEDVESQLEERKKSMERALRGHGKEVEERARTLQDKAARIAHLNLKNQVNANCCQEMSTSSTFPVFIFVVLIFRN